MAIIKPFYKNMYRFLATVAQKTLNENFCLCFRSFTEHETTVTQQDLCQ